MSINFSPCSRRTRFFSFVRRELEFPPELHTVGFGSGAALAGAGAYQLALKFSKARKYGVY